MVFLIVNKSDLLTPDDLSEVNRKLEAAATCHGTDFSDSVVISASRGTNFDAFENMIDRFLVENKNSEYFQTIKNSFFTCQNRNCQDEYFYDGDAPSNNPGYCGKIECKREIKGILCNNTNCPNHRPKLLPEDEGVYRSFNDESRNLYCSSNCRREVEGISCANTDCSNHRPKLFPNDEGVRRSFNDNSGNLYCNDTCRLEAEGVCCSRIACPNCNTKIPPHRIYREIHNNDGTYRYCSHECYRLCNGRRCYYKGCSNNHRLLPPEECDVESIKHPGEYYCKGACKKEAEERWCLNQ